MISSVSSRLFLYMVKPARPRRNGIFHALWPDVSSTAT